MGSRYRSQDPDRMDVDDEPSQSTSSQPSRRQTPPPPATTQSRREDGRHQTGQHHPYEHEQPPRFYFRTHSYDHRHASPPVSTHSGRYYDDQYYRPAERPRTSESSFRESHPGRHPLEETGQSHRFDEFRSRNLVSPRRQTMDPRDYSPRRSTDTRSYHESDRSYRNYPQDRRMERPEYGRYSPDPNMFSFRSGIELGYSSPHRHSRESDEYSRSRSNRYLSSRVQPFTLVHPPPPPHHESESSRPHEPIRLPPVNELLSSPEVRTPTQSSSGNNYVDPLERARSAKDRSKDDPDNTLHDDRGHHSHERRHSFQRPEEILESMRRQRSLPEGNVHSRENPLPFSYPEGERPDYPRRPELPHASRSHTGVTSAPRTGFPNSGVRSTAPATPPNPRYVPEPIPRYPGPSLGPLPPAPPRATYHSQAPPFSHPRRLSTSTHRYPRSHAPTERSAAPSPAAVPTRPRRSLQKTIQIAVTREETPKHAQLSQSAPAKSPPQHILEVRLPQLIPPSRVAQNSARILLGPPPHRDPVGERTREQDRQYAEWLFEASTNVQVCLTRAVSYCPEDVLKAADEMLIITLWIVSYLHQLGLSYYSQLRHEMRVAFWWKLNWSWLCVIQSSYDQARRPISDEEIDPWPNNESMRELADTYMEVETVKKEDRRASAEPVSTARSGRSSDQETISEPMEEINQAVPEHLHEFWRLAKRLNRKPKWPRHLGEDEWLAIGDTLVLFGNELAKYGLIDMDLGLWENEIIHRISAVMDAWREREMEILRRANEEFRKLNEDAKKVMIMALEEDEVKMEKQRL